MLDSAPPELQPASEEVLKEVWGLFVFRAAVDPRPLDAVAIAIRDQVAEAMFPGVPIELALRRSLSQFNASLARVCR